VLVTGCGNSLLSEKIHEHLKIQKILSIDFEESVINKMNERGVPIEYKAMDILNMSGIEDHSFDFVLDKGTLDALCSDKNEETKQKVVKYLNEV
jgi:2-polyprenyl-3-methyl-5-hydroxy-6-metoxy-1,4-benzoquinol methylase